MMESRSTSFWSAISRTQYGRCLVGICAWRLQYGRESALRLPYDIYPWSVLQYVQNLMMSVQEDLAQGALVEVKITAPVETWGRCCEHKQIHTSSLLVSALPAMSCKTPARQGSVETKAPDTCLGGVPASLVRCNSFCRYPTVARIRLQRYASLYLRIVLHRCRGVASGCCW